MTAKITRHQQLDVYKRAFAISMRIFNLSKRFPREEVYSLTDQVRRSSRSVCANIAEAWRKRRYEAHFISKLSDAEGEAAETQTWAEFAAACEYITEAESKDLIREYDSILATLVGMAKHADTWIITPRKA